MFALGCVLSEMVTGEPAFVRETVTETLSAILHGEPASLAGSSPGVPRSLAQVIRRCLAKDPVDRFQSTSDLPFAIRASIDADTEPATAAAGRRVPGGMWPLAAALLVAAGLAVWFGRGSTEAQPIRSVAVLPFENLGGDPATEYLGDGLADHVIHSLTAARGADLRVDDRRKHERGFAAASRVPRYASLVNGIPTYRTLPPRTAPPHSADGRPKTAAPLPTAVASPFHEGDLDNKLRLHPPQLHHVLRGDGTLTPLGS